MTDRNMMYGIGASDAPTVAGVGFQTPLQLWERLDAIKRGDALPPQEGLQLDIGKELEALVLRKAEQDLGQSIDCRQRKVLDLQRAWRWATLDGSLNSNELVEAKTTRSRSGWGESRTDEVPARVIAQCVHSMSVTGAVRVWVPVIFRMEAEFDIYKVERDEALIHAVDEMEDEFWHAHVLKGIPPPPTAKEASRVWRKDDGSTVVASSAIEGAVNALRAVKETAKRTEEEQERLEGEIKLAMAEHALLTRPNGEVICTWKTAKDSERVNWQTIAEMMLRQLPEGERQNVLRHHTETKQGSRRFLLK